MLTGFSRCNRRCRILTGVWYGMMCVPRVPHIPHTPRRTQRVPDARPLSAVRGPRFTVHGWCHPPILADLQASGVRSPLARAFPSFTLHSFNLSLFTEHCSLPTFCVCIPVLASRSALGAVGHEPWPACRRRIFLSFHVDRPSSPCSPHPSLSSGSGSASLILFILFRARASPSHGHRVPDCRLTRTLSLLHFTPIPFKLKLSGGIFKTLSAVRCHGRLPPVAGFPS